MNATTQEYAREAEWPWLAEAIEQANVPTLLMLLVHLTADVERWLQPRYQCHRIPGLEDFDTGGLDEELQQEIRREALAAVTAWKQGKEPALTKPDPDLLVRMLAQSVGEPVPSSYGDVIAADLGMDPAFELKQSFTGLDEASGSGFKVVVVGAGVSGICAAIRLQLAGVPYVILEKNHELTGTWFENHYPGCGVDTPSHIYSYSFAPHDWDMHFALQPDIKAYFDSVADAYGIRRNIRLGAHVHRTEFDEERGLWVTEFEQNGKREVLESNVLISAVGYLNTPKIADIDGLDSFTGRCFHTARWPKDLQLDGLNVAIIGNGATAMQVVPEIAPKVKNLTIFQRSKQWVAPFAQFRKRIPDGTRKLIMAAPFFRHWYRQRLAWIFNDRIYDALHIDANWPHPERAINQRNDRHRELFTAYMKQELGDRQDLLPELLPSYPPFGKRMLLDNGWFRALRRDNVRLINGEVVRVDGDTIHASGGEAVSADVLIVSTGFDAANVLSSFEIRGRGGRSIQQAWAESGPEAYMGVAIPGFPNLFVLAGPNTGYGHGGSIVSSLEWQVRHVLGLIQEAGSRRGSGFVLDVRQTRCAEYNTLVQEKHKHLIWAHRGMRSYYRNASGRVVGVTPFRTDQAWHLNRNASLDDYEVSTVSAEAVN